jgi:hypothetical protein
MAVQVKTNKDELYYVVHPLFDEPEEKINADVLGPMPMSKSVKLSLYALRGYLIVMGLLVAYHVFSLGIHHLMP